MRLSGAEAALVGKALDRTSLDAAAAIAMTEVKPMDDHRGTAKYRRAMVGSLLRKLASELGHGVASVPSTP